MDAITAYKDLTDAIEAATSLSRPMLHVYAGLIIYLGAQIALRHRQGPAIGLAAVIALELGNEIMNRLYWGSWRWADTIDDIVVTLSLPLCFFALAKIHHWRRHARQRARQLAARHIWAHCADMPRAI